MVSGNMGFFRQGQTVDGQAIRAAEMVFSGWSAPT